MNNRRLHLKHTGLKIITIICLVLTLGSISFSCYMVHRFNRVIDSFNENIATITEIKNDEISKLKCKVDTLSVYNTDTQKSITNLINIISSNNRILLEMILELDEKIDRKNGIIFL